MKALLDAKQFKQIMDGVKHAVSVNDIRQVLNYIKLDIKRETITAYALDGYRMAKVVITNTVYEQDNIDAFSVFIKPISIPKKTMDMHIPIEIEKNNNSVTVAIPTPDGKMIFDYTQPNSEYIDVEKVLADAQVHDRELAASSKYVSDAMNAISRATRDKNNFAVLQTKEDNTKPFIIAGKGNNIEITQIILPIRNR